MDSDGASRGDGGTPDPRSNGIRGSSEGFPDTDGGAGQGEPCSPSSCISESELGQGGGGDCSPQSVLTRPSSPNSETPGGSRGLDLSENGHTTGMQSGENRGICFGSSHTVRINCFQLALERIFPYLEYEIGVKFVTEPADPALKWDLVAIKQTVFGQRSIIPIEFLPGKSSASTEVHGNTYFVEIAHQEKIPLVELSKASFSKEILHGLDVIEKAISERERIKNDANCFDPKKLENLKGFTIALDGLQQHIRRAEHSRLASVDHSVMPFLKPMPVLEFLKKFLNIDVHVDRQLSVKEKAIIERSLESLHVSVTRRKTLKKGAIPKFKVHGLSQLETDNIWYHEQKTDAKWKLVDYYREIYEIDIMYKKLPCLSFSKKCELYEPMELCDLTEGQLFPRDNMLCYQQEILEKNTSQQSEEGTKNTPKMVYVSPDICSRRESTAEYQFKTSINGSVSKAKPITFWAILDFSGWTHRLKNDGSPDFDEFRAKLVRRISQLGTPMEVDPLFVEFSEMEVLSNPARLRQALLKCKTRGGDSLQLLLCLLAGKHQGYKMLKFLCENDYGILTQCCHPCKFNNMDACVSNLATKINAKVGGSRLDLFSSVPGLNPNCPIMCVGANVDLPKSKKGYAPTIAAVVASMDWPAMHSYAPIVQSQDQLKGIRDIGMIFRQLLDKFTEANGFTPHHIIYFRGSADDSKMFNILLEEELDHIRKALGSDDCRPKLLVVAAEGRRYTMLFPKDELGIKPANFDFYLCNIASMSKPTRYHVALNECGYTYDEIQKLVYRLCFTFPRCMRPVSRVPPLYYADSLARRGRVYYDGWKMLSSAEFSSASSSNEPAKLPKLHTTIKNSMFFL